MILSASAASSSSFSKKIVYDSGSKSDMSIDDSESVADIASTSTSDDVSAFDDSNDNARDEERLTLSHRKNWQGFENNQGSMLVSTVMKKIWRENGMESHAESTVEREIQYLVLEKNWANFCLVWKDQWGHFWWSVWCPRLDLALNYWRQCLVIYHATLVDFL